MQDGQDKAYIQSHFLTPILTFLLNQRSSRIPVQRLSLPEGSNLTLRQLISFFHGFIHLEESLFLQTPMWISKHLCESPLRMVLLTKPMQPNF